MIRNSLAFLAVCAFASVSATAQRAAIGYVSTGGRVLLDGMEVRETATLFEGVHVGTRDAAARIHLDSGASVWLAGRTSATLSRTGILLDGGSAQMAAPPSFALRTPIVMLASASANSLIRVSVDGSSVVVLPVRGSAAIANPNGIRVADVAEGQARRFSRAEGGENAVVLSGCLRRDGTALSLTDRIANLTMRLSGAVPDTYMGRLVQIDGTAAREPGVVTVVRVRAVTGEGCGSAPALLASAVAADQVPTTAGATGPRLLNLVIVEGDGAINNIRQRTAREPIVEVQDENHKPVAGALVLFAVPRSGPGGTFANGAQTLTVTTGPDGRATARNFVNNGQPGTFQISVTATYGALKAAAFITQQNVAALAAAGAASTGATGLSTAGEVAIIGGVATAGTVGGLAASGAIFTGSPAGNTISR